jgi:hypothetical protein
VISALPYANHSGRKSSTVIKTRSGVNFKLLMTYKHIFQRMFCEPAVEKHGDEEMPEGWKENLEKRKNDNDEV